MIELRDLTKRYAAATAVDGVTFACRPGTITGFLGPNGAGKSTTLRMLTGLTLPTSGSALVAGSPYSELPDPARVVGVLLDATAQHPARTGRETLRLAAHVLGVPAARADDALERVGLVSAAKKRVRAYSLGMRQRLGIATALLGDPLALVLDEPANGLDPEGIRWMRHLLREFADGGGTVLLSSHLLREVQATVDQLVVISRGRVVASGGLHELLSGPTSGTAAGSGSTTVVRSHDLQALAVVLRGAGLACTPGPGATLRVDAPVEAVGRAAAAGGQVVTELRSGGDDDLEDWFLALTDDTQPALREDAR